jgi:HEPN domain-containing protein
VDETKRKTIEGWINKASNQLQIAKEYLKSSYHVSDAVQAAQICVELSVKAVLTLLNIEFPASHGWSRQQIGEIAGQIRDRNLLGRLVAQNLQFIIPLPRLIFRANFWSHFYLEAKYGFEAGHLAPAQELFEKEDAELAVRHAEECIRAAERLRYMNHEQLAALTS